MRLGRPALASVSGAAVLSAAVSSAAVFTLWPATDGLRSTLLVLPWALFLWCFAARRVANDLGRPVSSYLPAYLGWSLTALVALAPWRYRLGWPAADELWLAALLALAALSLYHLLPALRRHLSTRPTPGLVFLALPLALYLAIQPWSLDHRQPDGDEPYYLLLTHSLAYDGDIDLANNYAGADWHRFMGREIESQPGDPEGVGGEIYSRHNALLPLLLAPAYRLAGRAGATATIAVMTALVGWLMLALALRLWPAYRGGALLAWILLAFTPPLILYSHQVWIEVPAALLTLIALDRLERLRSAGSVRRDLVILALALGLLPMLKLRLLLISAPLALLALGALGIRRAVAFLGALAVAISALLAYNQWRFGNPLKMYSSGEIELLASPPADWLRGLVGMFYDCAFGLFASAPIWLLLLPALLELIRRRGRFAAVLVVLVAPYMAALAPRLEWYGGWSPPFRYPLVFLPLGALAMVPLLDRRPAGVRVVGTVLALATGLLSLLWLAVPGWTYNLADGSSHLLHQAGLQFQADVTRFFPSTVRPRAATWWWLGITLAASPLVRVDGLRARRLALPVAFTAFFALSAALPLASSHLPTRVVEAEDLWVSKEGGQLVPDRWVPLRPSYRGGWRMASRTRLVAPVIVGGPRARVRIHVRRDTIGPHTLEVREGEDVIGTLSIDRRSEWRVFEFGPVSWPPGAPLVVISPQPARRDDLGLILDRIEISWLENEGDAP